MKRAGAAALLILALALTGCVQGIPKDDLDAVVKLKQECEDAGGLFTTWVIEEFDQYGYECNLSTQPEKDR